MACTLHPSSTYLPLKITDARGKETYLDNGPATVLWPWDALNFLWRSGHLEQWICDDPSVAAQTTDLLHVLHQGVAGVVVASLICDHLEAKHAGITLKQMDALLSGEVFEHYKGWCAERSPLEKWSNPPELQGIYKASVVKTLMFWCADYLKSEGDGVVGGDLRIFTMHALAKFQLLLDVGAFEFSSADGLGPAERSRGTPFTASFGGLTTLAKHIFLSLHSVMRKRRATLKHLFKYVNHGVPGILEPAEFLEGLQRLGIVERGECSPQQMADLMQDLDPNFDGRVILSEVHRCVQATRAICGQKVFKDHLNRGNTTILAPTNLYSESMPVEKVKVEMKPKSLWDFECQLIARQLLFGKARYGEQLGLFAGGFLSGVNGFLKSRLVTRFAIRLDDSKDELEMNNRTTERLRCAPMSAFTAAELARYDGEAKHEIYISFNGKVYDVSHRRDLYGKSPPGPYHALAGHECARSLSTMSVELCDVGRRDLEDLTTLTRKLEQVMSPSEVRQAVDKAFKDWERHFSEKYTAVGSCETDGSVNPVVSQGYAMRHPAFHKEVELSEEDFVESPLELISRKPKIFLQRKFLSPAECRMLIEMILQRKERSNFQTKLRAPLELEDARWSPEQRALILKIEEKVAEVSGGPIHPDETALVGTLTPPQAQASQGGVTGHLGLHVDTNAAHWRFCTAIIYLSSLGDGLCGGETVFPAALHLENEGPPSELEERAIEAAGELLDLNLDHTDKALNLSEDPAANPDKADRASRAARELLARADAAEPTGLRDDGEIDRFSWHGGAPLQALNGQSSERKTDIFGWKWTLQKFKEVPLSARADAAALADFIRPTRRAKQET
ncbi:Membrane-associated progesterone receptor component 1 (mPR), partial [Durusdinium trenchii]